MLLSLIFARKENLEIQPMFERKITHLLLGGGGEENVAAISLFQV